MLALLSITVTSYRAPEYQTIGSVESCSGLDTVLIDFDQGEYFAGDIVSKIQYTGGVVSIFGVNPLLPGKNAAMIFDSGNPTGGDLDLGTPNEFFGGPGMNFEGGPVLSNNVPLNNVLIVSEDLNRSEPDDATAQDIGLTFEFSSPVVSIGMDLLDLDSGEAELHLFDSLGNELYSDLVPETGCNGVARISLSVPGVTKMQILLHGSGAIDNIKFIVACEGLNSNPVAVNDNYETEIEEPLTIEAPGVLVNDTDADGDTLTIIEHDTSSVQGGTIDLNPDGGFTYTPPDGFEGEDTFTYTVSDGNGAEDSGNVTIDVVFELSGGDDEGDGGDEGDGDGDVDIIGARPEAKDDNYTTEKNTGLDVDAPGVLANDSDPDGDTITIIAHDTTSSAGGQVTLNADGSFTFTPPSDTTGVDTFTYTVSDPDGNTDTAMVSITITEPVTPQNSPPNAEDDELETDLDSELVITDPTNGVLENDSDPDGDAIAVQEVIDGITDQGGRINIHSDGTLSYIPKPGFIGTDSVDYTICDSQDPQLCDSATIYILVNELPIEVFSAFSPNGDGVNDSWIIQGITRFPDNVVRIFNRWGNLIFEVSGYDNTTKVWNGNASEGVVFGNSEAPDGAYFYIIDLGDGSERLSGYVVIRR